MKRLLTAIHHFFIPCPDSLGHHYGMHSDLCLNWGCNAERGSWEPCRGEPFLQGLNGRKLR